MADGLDEGLYQHLAADSAIQGIIGAGNDIALYWDNIPQAIAPPFTVMLLVSQPETRSADGPSCLANPRVQIDSFAKTKAQARALSDAVRSRLDGFRGQLGFPATQVLCKSAALDDTRGGYLDNRELYRMSQDFLLWVEVTA